MLVTNKHNISRNVKSFNLIQVTDIPEIFTASICSVED
jgi:hypothetical protein